MCLERIFESFRVSALRKLSCQLIFSNLVNPFLCDALDAIDHRSANIWSGGSDLCANIEGSF